MRVLTRPPGASFATDCLLTYVERAPIDPELALRQHAAWRAALAAAGCAVEVLDPLPELPDSVFVEDTALVLPEVVVLCRPADATRRPEVDAIEGVLAGRGGTAPVARPLVRVEAPATLEGGDVLVLGRRLFVGRTTRTDDAGIAALAAAVSPFGREIRPVDVAGALHLKTACAALDDDTVLVDPARVDPGAFGSAGIVEVHPDEPVAANVFRAPRAVLMGASGPRTAEAIRAAGFPVRRVDLSEIEKGEGGPTCLGLVVPGPSR